MKNVMTRAWEIAKKGQKRFGGKVKEYFTHALVIAWTEYKSKAAQLAAIEAKGLNIYNKYIKHLITKGATLLSKENTNVVLSIPEKNYRKNALVTYEMSDFDVFAKIVINKQVKYVNLGSAF